MGGRKGPGENKVGYVVYYDNPMFDEVGGEPAFSLEERGKFITWMRDYDMYGTAPALDGKPVKTIKAWGAIERAMDIASDKYRKTCEERSEAGRKGAAARAANKASEAIAANAANVARAANQADTVTRTGTRTATDSFGATSSKPLSTTCKVTFGSRDMRSLKSRPGEDIAVQCPSCHGQMYARYDEAAGKAIADCGNCGWKAT